MDQREMAKERNLDEWLEAELHRYTNSEPRPGLEARVLAQLKTERDRVAVRRRWWWAASVAAAMAVIIAVAWVGSGNQGQTSSGTSVAHQHDSTPLRQSAASSALPTHGRKANRQKAVRPNAMPMAAPKLEQFPAPAPLSDQEQVLARYVREFHDRAVLVARAQTELRKQDERETAAAWPSATDSTVPDQKE